MTQLLLLPVLVPLLAGALLLMLEPLGLRTQRAFSVGASLVLVPVAAALVAHANAGVPLVYHFGDWPAPYGIVLVLDRLSAALVLVTSLVALAAAVAASHGDDENGARLHALLQFLFLGVNGAFLTGDLFNLFVCFELLLIASYGLLVYRGGPQRTRSALHVVALNLVGSAIFLVAIGCVYAAAGTLNFADLAARVRAADGVQHSGLLDGGLLLLAVVFALKAAALPLGFWLPRAYGLAIAPIACAFAVLTKVGVYALLRVHGMVFADLQSVAALSPMLVAAGLATVVVGSVGALGAKSLGLLLANLVVVSSGTLVTALGLDATAALGGALFYLLHSTPVAAGMFLLAGLIARQLGDGDGRVELRDCPLVAQPVLLGCLFLTGALAIGGLPPLAGFPAKLWILGAAVEAGGGVRLLALLVVLGGGLVVLLALSRAFSVLFWRPAETAPALPSAASPASGAQVATVAALVGVSGVMMAAALPVQDYVVATAAELLAPDAYVQAVLTNLGAGWGGNQ